MPIVAGASDPSPANVRQRAIALPSHRSAGMNLVKNTIPPPFSLDRLLPTPSRDDAVTDPSLPHTVNSAGGTCTRLFIAFIDAHLSLRFTDPFPRLRQPSIYLSLRFSTTTIQPDLRSEVSW